MNDKQLDKSFLKKVTHVQKHNGINVFWDKEGVWKKIQKALADSAGSPKMVAWYAAMAASVSLLVASTVTLPNFDWLPFEKESDQVVAEETDQRMDQPSRLLKAQFVALPTDSMVIPAAARKINLVQVTPNVKVLQPFPEDDKRARFYRNTVETITANNARQSKLLGLYLKGGASVNSKFIVPRVDMGISIDLSKHSRVSQKIVMATSLQFMQGIGSETSSANNLSKAYFIKTAFEQEKLKNGKLRGWSTGVEYLIHADDSSIPKMMKVFYTRDVMRRLRVGPELLITRKKIYPGLTLAFG